MKWNYNENVEIELPEATLEAFDKFMKDSMFRVFIDKDSIKSMREKFKEDFNLK